MRLYLRKLTLKDANKGYVRWMNDAEVVKFLESRSINWTVKKLRAYIRSKSDCLFLAIVLNDRHIGNIKIQPTGKVADIGIMIGEKSCWGKGYATEAIKLATKYAFEKLNIDEITAGFHCENIASMKAFQKAGYQRRNYEPRNL